MANGGCSRRWHWPASARRREADARELAEAEAIAAALRFAQRRAIGPFAADPPDQARRERALAAMIRAGHRFPIARAIVDLETR